MARLQPSYKSGFARSVNESANPNLWKGLVGAWIPSIGISGSTLYDISGYKNDGIFTGGLDGSSWVQDEMGYAINFQSSAYYIFISEKYVVNAFTIIGWIKPAIWQFGRALEWGPEGSDSLSWFDNNVRRQWRRNCQVNWSVVDFKEYTEQIIENEWNMLATTRDSSGLLTDYHQSVPLGTSTKAGEMDPDGLIIGHDSSSYDETYGPYMLYNRDLSQNEIRQLYLDPLAPFRLRRRVFIDAAPPVGGNEGAAMYHHLQNIGAY